jgi:hypothetical protein
MPMHMKERISMSSRSSSKPTRRARGEDAACREEAARGAEAATLDRRQFPRVPHRATFNIRPLLPDGVGAPLCVVLQDISSSGMGIWHSLPLRVGDQFQIPLTRERTDPLTLICTCVRCEKLDERLYSVGFEFNSPTAAVDEGSRQLTGKPVRRD